MAFCGISGYAWRSHLCAPSGRILFWRRRQESFFPVQAKKAGKNHEVLDAAYRSLKSRRAETVTVVGKER
jgi:hypothetical protein